MASDRPMMLKDFLRDDIYPTKKSTIPSKSNPPLPPAVVLLRSWSRRAAKVSAIQRVVKLLQFVKCPRRKLAEGRRVVRGASEEVKVKVKDILRLRSFSYRDMAAEDESVPLGLPPSPNRIATTTSSSRSCSKRSSWCDSDFSAEYLPLCGGENELLRNKGDWTLEEYEQQSPVSVLDSPFREVIIGPNSPFHPSLAKFQRVRYMLALRIQKPDEGTAEPKHTRNHSFGGGVDISKGVSAVEEKAKQLLNLIKQDNQNQQVDDHTICDFFMDEVSMSGKLYDVGFDNEILSRATSWINGEYDEPYEWEVEEKRKAYVKDMEKGVSWSNFKQEQEEISMELEVKVFNELIDEVLSDLLTK